MTRLVQLSVNAPSPSSDLKVRVYYPVRLLTGPDLRVIRTYDDYLKYYGEDSFAQLLFNWNYELLCHRISYVDSRANLTKYLIDGEYKYYQDTGKYYLSSTLIPPSSTKQTHKNSFLFIINQNASNYNDFYVIIRTKIYDVKSDLIYNYSMGLFGCDYIVSQDPTGQGSYDLGKSYIRNHFDLEPLSKSVFLPLFIITEEGYKDAHLDLNGFEAALRDFLLQCGLMVESLGYKRILASTASEETSYSLYSNLVTVEELEDHYDRYYASTYKSHRILSISSKDKSAYSNIVVNVEKLDTRAYSVHVSKTSGDWVGEEYFTVDPYVEALSTNTVRTFEEINLLSELIDIEAFIDPLHEDEFDPTGVYRLKGSFGFNDKNLYLNRLAILTDELIDGYLYNDKFYSDIDHTEEIEPELDKVYQDLESFLYYVWDGSAYIDTYYIDYDTPQVDVAMSLESGPSIPKELNVVFPQAMIVTGPNDPIPNGIRVNPSTVYWYNYEEEIPSGFAVLDLLMTTSYYNDATQFRLPAKQLLIPETRYDLKIEQADYGVEIKSVYVYRNSQTLRYTNRAFLARAIIYRVCSSISQTSVDEIRNYITNMCSQVAGLFNLNLTYELKNESQVGRSYTADLMILVDNKLFTRFEIYTELNYEG